jgi:hypothetical protein
LAEYVELYIDQGTDFSTTINIDDDNTNLPTNIQSYVVTSSMRRSLLSPNASSNLVCSVADAANGTILMEMTAANTSNLRPGTYFFDVRTKDVVNNNFYTRLIEGVIFVTPSVTKV